MGKNSSQVFNNDNFKKYETNLKKVENKTKHCKKYENKIIFLAHAIIRMEASWIVIIFHYGVEVARINLAKMRENLPSEP